VAPAAVAVLVDGRPATALDVHDRGLAYGDGLFETIAVVGGRPRHLPRHLHRLARGCTVLGLPAPDPILIEGEIDALLEPGMRALIKLILTRGSGGRGYRPPCPAQPRRVLVRHPWPAPDAAIAAGVQLGVCRTRLAEQPVLAGIKHLNRLEQVIASAELAPDQFEGLMLDGHERVIEGTRSNLFLVLGDTLVTPDLGRCGVAGIMRELVLEGAAALELAVQVRDVALGELAQARELFVCNVVLGLCPVRAVRGQVADLAVPGPLTARLQAALGAARALPVP